MFLRSFLDSLLLGEPVLDVAGHDHADDLFAVGNLRFGRAWIVGGVAHALVHRGVQCLNDLAQIVIKRGADWGGLDWLLHMAQRYLRPAIGSGTSSPIPSMSGLTSAMNWLRASALVRRLRPHWR